MYVFISYNVCVTKVRYRWQNGAFSCGSSSSALSRRLVFQYHSILYRGIYAWIEIRALFTLIIIINIISHFKSLRTYKALPYESFATISLLWYTVYVHTYGLHAINPHRREINGNNRIIPDVDARLRMAVDGGWSIVCHRCHRRSCPFWCCRHRHRF